MSGNGANPINVTGPGGESHQEPDFSPDGRRIAFHRIGGSPLFQIVIMDADGTDQAVLATGDPPGGLGSPEFSPDGKRILFNRGAPGSEDIW